MTVRLSSLWATAQLTVELGRALAGRTLLRLGGRLADAQDPAANIAAGLVAGVGHRVAVAGCVCANLDPRSLIEPEDPFTRRVAGLPLLEVAEAARFAEIVEHLRARS